MNKEDIVRMAREAGMEQDGDNFFSPSHEEIDVHITDLERFAALVSDAAKLEMLMAGHDEWLEEARKAEREACAKVCETNHGTIKRSLDSFECAAAIRARGNT